MKSARKGVIRDADAGIIGVGAVVVVVVVGTLWRVRELESL